MSAQNKPGLRLVSDDLEKYKKIFYNLNIMVVIHDALGNIHEINDKVLETFGYSADEILPSNIACLLTEEMLATCSTIIAETLKRGSASQEVTLKKKSGETFPVYTYTNMLNIDDRQLILCVMDDLSELKKAENRIRNTNLFLDSIIENIPDMIFLKDARDLRFVRFNKAGEELLGYSRDELLGKNDYDFFTSQDRKVLESDGVVEIPEEQIHTRSKGMRTLHTKKIALRDENGEPVYLLGISEDVTERKQLEEKFELVVEASPNAIILADDNGSISFLNSHAELMFGYERSELAGRPVEILLPERLRAAHRKHRKTFGKESVPYRMGIGRELLALHKNGGEFPVEIDLTPIFTKDGITNLISITDITYRKKREEWMRIRDRAFDAASNGILITGTIEEGNNIIHCNPAFEEMTGYSRDEVIGRNCRFLHGDDRAQEALGELREAMRRGKSFKGTLRNYKKDGTLFWNELIVSPVRDERGKITHFVGILNDATARKEAEEALRKSRDELEDKIVKRTIELMESNKTLKTEIEVRKEAEEALQINLEQLSRKNRYEEIVNTVTRAVHQSIDVDVVIEHAIEAMSGKIEYLDIIAIYMVEEQEAVLKTHRGHSKEFIKRAGRIPYPKGATWNTIIEGKSVYVPDVDKSSVLGEAGRNDGMKSYLATPLFSEGKAVGVIFMISRRTNAFDEEELKLLETVSHQIETAIDNARHAEALAASEQRYRTLFSQSPVGVCTIDKDLKITHCNERLIEIFQSSRDKIIGLDLKKLKDKSFVPFVEKAFEGHACFHETRYEATISGASLWLSVRAAPLKNSDGNVVSVMGVVIDISARKQAEEALKANLEQLSKKNRYEEIISTVTRAVHKSSDLGEVLENAVEVMSRNIDVVDHVSIYFVEGSDAVMKAHRGYPGWFIERIERIPRPKGFTWACINAGKVIHCPDAEADGVIGPAGKEVGTRSYVAIPLNDGGETIGCINVHSLHINAFEEDDVRLLETIGQQIEIALNKSRDAEALRNSEERYRAIVEHTYNLIIETDIFGTITYANHLHKEILGYDSKELIGKNCLDLVYEEDRREVAEAFQQAALSGQAVETARYRCRHKNGELRWLESTGKAYADSPGEIRGIISSRDITARKKAEEAKREIEDRHRALIEHSYDIIVETTSDGRFSYLNPTFTELLGYDIEDVLGRSIFEYVYQDDIPHVRAEFMRVMTSFDTGNAVFRFRHKNGEWRWMESSGRPFRTISGEVKASISTRDITERKKAEEQLQKAFSEIKRLKNQLEQENLYLQEEVREQYYHGEIYGSSKAIKDALSLAGQVANTQSTVLLLGETGTGKELMAYAIHNMSPRKDRALVAVNCASLPPSLVDTELFGHEKGAFTGAISRRMGRFEVADGSTIFLDEIGELPPEIQSKLLRVLETGRFERLGSTITLTTNVRVIAATNRDLAKAVREGKFREDLFYRLNVFPIHLPPLRERKEDIPILVDAFTREFSEKMGKNIEKIPKRTMNALLNYAWPGNVRELRNIIERGAIISRDNSLNVDLPGIRTSKDKNSKQLSDLEKEHITEVLLSTNWRVRGKGGAAEILGMKPTTLESKMRRLGIGRLDKTPDTF